MGNPSTRDLTVGGLSNTTVHECYKHGHQATSPSGSPPSTRRLKRALRLAVTVIRLRRTLPSPPHIQSFPPLSLLFLSLRFLLRILRSFISSSRLNCHNNMARSALCSLASVSILANLARC